MENKGERLAVSVSNEMLCAIDNYRFAQREGSRSEIIRRLIEIGLAHVGHPVDTSDTPQEAKSTHKAK